MVPLHAPAVLSVRCLCAFQGCGDSSQITEVQMPPDVISYLNSELNECVWMFAHGCLLLQKPRQ